MLELLGDRSNRHPARRKHRHVGAGKVGTRQGKSRGKESSFQTAKMLSPTSSFSSLALSLSHISMSAGSIACSDFPLVNSDV